jgi:arylsulfatase A-like enzyme
MFADDMGYGDLGSYGAKGYTTPNLDRMAKEGVRFTDFYVSQPVCSASRAALMTGCYSSRVDIQGALSPKAEFGLSHDEMTIAEVVKQKGYATAMFGKWHLGHHEKFLPTTQGFDEYYGLPYSNDMSPMPQNNPGKNAAKAYPPLPLIEGTKTIETEPDQSKLTTAYTERAVSFIKRNKEKPFFLYVPHAMVHVPLYVSDKFKGKTERGLYGDVMEEVDWSMGEILKTLKEEGLDENTLVIFTSDNGPWSIFGNHAGSAGPLRESKGTCYEGGVREPFIARWPGKIPAGKVSGEPCMTIDLLPTIAKLTGASLPPKLIDGKDIWPLLAGEPGAKSPHEALFFYYADNQLQGMRSGKWKLIFPHTCRSTEGATLGADGKMGEYVQRKTGRELYDLSTDVGEKTDVSAQHPEVIGNLQKMAETMRQDLGDSLTGAKGSGVRPHETL